MMVKTNNLIFSKIDFLVCILTENSVKYMIFSYADVLESRVDQVKRLFEYRKLVVFLSESE